MASETFKKRQKEMARVEKQLEKAAKRQQRKLAGPAEDDPDEDQLLDGPPSIDDDEDAVPPLSPPAL